MSNKIKLKLCPFRVHGEREPSLTIEGAYYYSETFMPCMGKECPAFWVKEEYSYRLGETEYAEHCLRLGEEKK